MAKKSGKDEQYICTHVHMLEEHFFSILVISPPDRLASHLVNVLHLLSLKEKSGDLPPLPSHKHAQAFSFFFFFFAMDIVRSPHVIA